MNRPPKVGDFYRLEDGYRRGSHGYGVWLDSGIYIVTLEDNNKVELRLVSKMEFHGSGRRWLKKSKFTDTCTHAEFKLHYKDDAVDYLKKELELVKEGYKQVLGEDI